jgi:hypothetical protein
MRVYVDTCKIMQKHKMPQPDTDSLLLTASQLRFELGNISASQLYKMVKNKVFTPIKGLGKRNRRFPRKQLQDFIDSNN